MSVEDLQKCAQAAYERWGMSYNGMLLPWNMLAETERATWRAIAEAAVNQAPPAPVPVLGQLTESQYKAAIEAWNEVLEVFAVQLTDNTRAIIRAIAKCTQYENTGAAAGPPDGDLINRACNAAVTAGASCAFSEQSFSVMAAIGRVFQQDRDARWKKAIKEEVESYAYTAAIHSYDLSARVLARVEDRPKTLEERVSVKRLGASEAVFVYADGNIIGPQFETEKDADRYRLGLIAELAKEQK